MCSAAVLGYGVLGEAFEFFVDEVAEVPAVEVFVGELACGVVAAGEDFGDVVDLRRSKFLWTSKE